MYNILILEQIVKTELFEKSNGLFVRVFTYRRDTRLNIFDRKCLKHDFDGL